MSSINPLPNEYRKVEYLQGNGGQCINTGIVLRSGLVAKYKLSFASIGVIQQICASINDSQCRLYFPYLVANNSWTYGYNKNVYTISNAEAAKQNEIYDVEAIMKPGRQIVYINSQEVGSGSDSGSWSSPSNSMYLFSSSNPENPRYSYARIYSFSISDADTAELLANYIPCVRNSDSKPGMYDTISKTFLTNYRSGDFIIPT